MTKHSAKGSWEFLKGDEEEDSQAEEGSVVGSSLLCKCDRA